MTEPSFISCHGQRPAVINSRKVCGLVYRRRSCVFCNRRWTTWEIEFPARMPAALVEFAKRFKRSA